MNQTENQTARQEPVSADNRMQGAPLSCPSSIATPEGFTPRSGKQIIAERIANLRTSADRMHKHANDLEALHRSIPELLTPEAEKGLYFLAARIVVTLTMLFAFGITVNAAMDDDAPKGTNATAVASVLVEAPSPMPMATNYASWTWDDKSVEWLKVQSARAKNTAPANTTVISKREPVVVQGTNGTWTISFPDVVPATERITTAGKAVDAANQMFKQGAAFGALAKDRNKDVEDVPSLVILAEKLWNQARSK